jgi:hypothetical protein
VVLHVTPPQFNTGLDATDLRNAVTNIIDTSTDPTNTIDLAGGVYTLTAGELPIIKNVTFQPDPTDTSGQPVVIDAQGSSRVFEIGLIDGGTSATPDTPLSVEFDNLTIQGGSFTGSSATPDALGGGIKFVANVSDPVAYPNTLTISSCNIQNNTVTSGVSGGAGGGAYGGGVYTSGVNVSFTDSMVTGNAALGSDADLTGGAAAGGGIYAAGRPLDLANTHVDGNTVVGGQGFDLKGIGRGGAAAGGGVYLSGSGLLIAGGTVSNNSVTGGGGSHLGAAGDGGGVYLNAGELKLVGAVVDSNISKGGGGADAGVGRGGGVYSDASSVEVDGSEISTNVATAGANAAAYGGAIYADGTTLAISGSTVSHNTAAAGSGAPAVGGGIRLDGPSGLMEHVYLGWNVARGGDAGTTSEVDVATGGSAEGGGMVATVRGGTFPMTDCEVEYNTAHGGDATADNQATGGAAELGGVGVLALDADGHVSITAAKAVECGFLHNKASGGTGTVMVEGGTATGGNARVGGVEIAVISNCTIGGASAGPDGEALGGAVGGHALNGGSFYAILNPGSAVAGGLDGAPDDPGRPSTDPPLMYTIANSTVSGNTAMGGTTSPYTGGNGIGGGVYGLGEGGNSNINVYSTIISGNSAAFQQNVPVLGVDIYGGTSLGYNLVLDSNGAGSTFGNGHPDQLSNGATTPFCNPGLGGPKYNGGFSQTMAETSTSTAINAGQNNGVTVNWTDANGGPHSVVILAPSFPNDQRDAPSVRTFANSTILPGYPSVADGTDIGAFEYQPPVVQQIAVNDDGSQRSEVESITVMFSQPVLFAGADPTAQETNAEADVELQKYVDATHQYSVLLDARINLKVPQLNPFQDTTDYPFYQRRVVTFTFDHSNVTTNPDPQAGVIDYESTLNGAYQVGGQYYFSLADGQYLLTAPAPTVAANAITEDTGGLGLSLTGDATLATITPFVSGLDTGSGMNNQWKLYRLFGDIDGSGVVNAFDYGNFRLAYGSTSTTPGYQWFLDADFSGAINAFDYGQFRLRYGLSVI